MLLFRDSEHEIEDGIGEEYVFDPEIGNNGGVEAIGAGVESAVLRSVQGNWGRDRRQWRGSWLMATDRA